MADHEQAQMLGPWMTLALVISGVIGVGIFFLPIALAPLGGSVPFGWLISGIGVMSMAYCASRIVSPDGGGLQAYVENELGPARGFHRNVGHLVFELRRKSRGRTCGRRRPRTIVPGLPATWSSWPPRSSLVSDAGEPARDQALSASLHRDCADQGASASCRDRHRGAAWTGGASLQPIDVPAASLGNIATRPRSACSL